MGSLHPSVWPKESTMSMLFNLVLAVMICRCSALKDQPKGEIQQDGSSNRQQAGPPKGHYQLDSGFLSDRHPGQGQKCKATFGDYEILCCGGCGQSLPTDNHDWCYTHEFQTLFSWDYCTCDTIN